MFRFFFGERKHLDFYVEYFKPTWKKRLSESWFKAEGYEWFEKMHLETRKALGRESFEKCYICGRSERRPLGWDKLLPTYDEQLKSIEYVCSDHGGIWWNCLEGKEIVFSHKPYWQRRIRDFYYILIQKIIIPIRFVWFFLFDIYFWYIAIWGYLFWKEFKRKLCES